MQLYRVIRNRTYVIEANLPQIGMTDDQALEYAVDYYTMSGESEPWFNVVVVDETLTTEGLPMDEI